MHQKTTSISDNIRFLREQKGYSQECMAELLNISQQTYSINEKYPEKLSLSRIKEIAVILEVKVSFLLNEDDSFVLNNFNQQGGQAISLYNSSGDKNAYEVIIKQLEKEVEWLRELVSKTIPEMKNA